MGEARRDPKSPQYLGGRDLRSCSLWESFRYAWDGLSYIYVSQRNMRIHVFLASLAFGACIVGGVEKADFFMVALAVMAVLSAEVVNTLTESLVDLMNPEYSVIAKIIKDVAAAGVLLTAGFSLVVGAVVFLPLLGDLPGVFEGFVAHRWPYFLAHVVVFVLPSLWGVIYFACREGAELNPGDGLGLGAPPTGSEDASQGPTVSGSAGTCPGQEEK